MTTFTVSRLDHVTVTTPEDLEQVVLEWYGRVLGLQRLPKPNGTSAAGGWFRLGDRELHVATEPHAARTDAHFAIVVDDLDAATGHLRQQGCAIEPAGKIPGRERCYTRDPAGNRIEIMSYDEPARA
jgi:catechol 2,3-dioxygenase-like lactoylglutathione lyase family enzyme